MSVGIIVTWTIDETGVLEEAVVRFASKTEIAAGLARETRVGTVKTTQRVGQVLA